MDVSSEENKLNNVTLLKMTPPGKFRLSKYIYELITTLEIRRETKFQILINNKQGDMGYNILEYTIS